MNLSFLAGKKSYLWALAVIVFAITGVLLGYLDTSQAAEYVVAAFGYIFLRLGITKSGQLPEQTGG